MNQTASNNHVYIAKLRRMLKEKDMEIEELKEKIEPKKEKAVKKTKKKVKKAVKDEK